MENTYLVEFDRDSQALKEFKNINESINNITKKANEILANKNVENSNLFYHLNKDLDASTEIQDNKLTIAFNINKNFIHENLANRPYEYNTEILSKVLKLRNKKLNAINHKFDEHSVEVALNIKSKTYEDIIEDMEHYKKNYEESISKVIQNYIEV